MRLFSALAFYFARRGKSTTIAINTERGSVNSEFLEHDVGVLKPNLYSVMSSPKGGSSWSPVHVFMDRQKT